MSNTPTHGSDTQIPGWWIASDGRWYPPETHPNYVPPPPPPPVAAPPVADAVPYVPAVEAPVVETPSYSTPSVEAPVVETPSYSTPAVEAPVVETPSYSTPSVEAPVVETPSYSTPSVDAAAEAATGLTGGLGDVAGSVTGGLGDVAGSVTGGLGDVAGSVTGGLGDVAGSVTGGLPGGIGDVAGGLSGGAGDVAGGITGKLGDVAGGITGKLGGGAAIAGGALAAGAGGLTSGASGLIDQAKDALPGVPEVAAPNYSTPTVPAPAAGQAIPVADPEPATILLPREEAVAALQEPIEVATPPMPEVVGEATGMHAAVEVPEVLAAPAPVTAHATPPAPTAYPSAPAEPVMSSAPVAPTYAAPEKPSYPVPDPIIQMDKPKRNSLFAGIMALVAGALAIAGSLFQWATGSAESGGSLLETIDVYGMDSNGLGVLIAGAALCVIGLFLMGGIGKQSLWGVLALIAGLVIVGLAVFSFVDINGLDESYADALQGDSRVQNGALTVTVKPAIGLWLATAGGVLGVLAAPFVNRK